MPSSEHFISNEATDDDSWLNVDPGELESMLEAKFEPSETEKLEKNREKLEKMAQSFGDFMKGESGIEGVELDQSEGNVSGSDEELSENSEDDEVEVLEAILNDPDLLMKIIERNEATGIDSQELISKLLEMSLNLQPKENEDEDQFDDFMSTMDAELMEKLKSSFSKTVEPLDVDFNLASNLLNSMKAEAGEPGPSSSMLKSMGLSQFHELVDE